MALVRDVAGQRIWPLTGWTLASVPSGQVEHPKDLDAANLIWIPIGNKLKYRSQQEADERWIVVEGVMGLQAGDNPRVLREKLTATLPPAERAAGASAAVPAAARAMAEGGE